MQQFSVKTEPIKVTIKTRMERGYKMQLQKLSANVSKRANKTVRRIIMGLCALASLAILGVILFYTVRNNSERVQLYSSQIDSKMSQKAAFINTVAAGAPVGADAGDYYTYVDTMAGLYDDVSAVYVCVKQKGVVYQDGIMTYMSGGWVPDKDFIVTDRAWYSGAAAIDDVYVSEPYVDEQTGNICITLSKAIYRNGAVIGVAGMDMYMDDLVKLIEGSYQGGNYVFLTTGEGIILTHPDKELALNAGKSTTVKEALNGRYEKVCKKALSTKLIWDYKGGLKFAVSNPIEATGWSAVAVISLSGVVTVIILAIILAAALCIMLGSLLKRKLTKGISPMFMPLEELAANVSKISEGQLDYSFQIDGQSQEVNALSVALNDTIKGLWHYISEITNTVTAISEKNLNFDVDGIYEGDYEKIKDALGHIVEVLNDSFLEINEQAAMVLNYSRELSETSESVAAAATAQNASVQNASEEMGKLTANMEKIAEFAGSIKTNTDYVNNCLALGNEEMDELVKAMDEIVECYEEIAGFVTEINAIASQTNLLALNASIEAARAGEAGKGFAVVADEISGLSASSSKSSSEISSVITKSLESVERGKKLVEKTDKTISDSAEYSAGNTKMVNEIVSFVDTQKSSADEILANIRAISGMVENNAASAEENAAISDSLGSCAQSLMNTVAQFRLKK